MNKRLKHWCICCRTAQSRELTAMFWSSQSSLVINQSVAQLQLKWWLVWVNTRVMSPQIRPITCPIITLWTSIQFFASVGANVSPQVGSANGGTTDVTWCSRWWPPQVLRHPYHLTCVLPCPCPCPPPATVHAQQHVSKEASHTL